MDVGLPDGKGDDPVSEWRALAPTLPVVIGSGSDLHKNAGQLAEHGGISLLCKPYTEQQFTLSYCGLEFP